MAEEASGGLTQKFKNAVKWVGHHLFSPTMIFMMVAMALPAVSVAATAVASKATLGDIGLAVWDHYKTMLTAPFTEFDTVKDAFSNAANGNWAAGSYEMGGAHAGHMAMEAAQACDPFSVWQPTASPAELSTLETAAKATGMTKETYYSTMMCSQPG